jgi:hypothetical protein
VLWLNFNPENEPDDESTDDGLVIYEKHSADQLLARGISKYSTVHPDFYSYQNNLNINVTEVYPLAAVEVIPRKLNRMVIIAPKRPFTLTLPGKFKNKAFQAKTVFALVIILVPKR